MPAHRLLAAAVAGLAVVTAGSLTQTAHADTRTAGTAFVRAAHLSPDTPSVDVYLTAFSGGTKKLWLSGVGYGDFSGYRRITAGTYAVSMRKHGAAASSPAALSWTITLRNGGAYTAAAVGENAKIRGVVLADSLRRPATGTGLIRVIQASSQAGRVRVAANGGSVFTNGVDFGSTTDYVPVKVGKWTVQARSATDPSLSTQAAVSVASQSVTSLVVLDAKNGGLVVRPLVDAAGASTVPAGAVPAGGGGTAQHRIDDSTSGNGLAGLAVAALVLTAGGAFLVRRRVA